MTTLPPIDHFIPLTQAAKRLGIAVSSLKKRIKNGNIKAASLNGTLALAESDLDQVIVSSPVSPSTTLPGLHLNMPVPPHLEVAVGYLGKARFYGPYWTSVGDEAMVTNGRTTHDGCWWGYQAFVDHPVVMLALGGKTLCAECAALNDGYCAECAGEDEDNFCPGCGVPIGEDHEADCLEAAADERSVEVDHAAH